MKYDINWFKENETLLKKNGIDTAILLDVLSSCEALTKDMDNFKAYISAANTLISQYTGVVSTINYRIESLPEEADTISDYGREDSNISLREVRILIDAFNLLLHQRLFN